MRPKTVTAASMLAVLAGVLGIAGTVWIVVRAQHTADVVLRDHPEISRHLVLDATYGLAVFSLVLSGLYLLASWALLRGRRWAWIVLVVLGSVGLLRALGRPTGLGLLSVLPDIALLGCLLSASARAAFAPPPRAQSPLPAHNSPY